MAQKSQSPEFSNSIFVKFLGHSFLYFKLLIYLHEPVTGLIYSTSRPPPAFCSIFVHKWTLGYHTFKTTLLKEMTMKNLITAKNEFDPYDAMAGLLAIDSLQIS